MSDYSLLPSWLVFSAGSRTFSGQPTTTGKLYIIYGVTVTYPSTVVHESISTFIINVQNSAATVATSINSASPVVGSNYTLQFDSGTFVDPEGDTLNYYASRQSGDPLPQWAFFVPTTRTFRIIAPVPQVLLLQVRATDRTDQSIVNNFKLNFTNAPPRIVTAMPDLTVNTQEYFEYRIPLGSYTDPANQNVSLTHNILSIPNLAGWLRFNPLTWVMLGAPPADSVGTYTIQL